MNRYIEVTHSSENYRKSLPFSAINLFTVCERENVYIGLKRERDIRDTREIRVIEIHSMRIRSFFRQIEMGDACELNGIFF